MRLRLRHLLHAGLLNVSPRNDSPVSLRLRLLLRHSLPVCCRLELLRWLNLLLLLLLLLRLLLLLLLLLRRLRLRLRRGGWLSLRVPAGRQEPHRVAALQASAAREPRPLRSRAPAACRNHSIWGAGSWLGLAKGRRCWQ